MPERENMEQILNEQIQREANKDLRKLMEASEDFTPLTPESADQEMLYGKAPDKTEALEIRERKFGAQFYMPKEGLSDKATWVICQHGYAGSARDYSKLAEILNAQGTGVISLDMHVNGKDDFEKMSMRVEEWAEAARKCPEVLRNNDIEPENLIFIGQSSGGSGGAKMLEGSHEYNGAILIGPTLVTPEPEFVQVLDATLAPYKDKCQDVMMDWRWLAPMLNQMHDEELNAAYQSHFTTTPGFPVHAARESYHIPREEILNNLDKITVPTFMVKGEFDQADKTSLGEAEKELATHENRNVEIKPDIKDAGHQAEIEKPEAIAELIKELLEKTKANVKNPRK